MWGVRYHPYPLPDIISGTQTTTFILLPIELPFKCSPEEFEKIYQEEYKGKISHGFIRSGLGLKEGVKIKLNGTFKRWLYLLDEEDNLYKVLYRIQTALWTDSETGKDIYVSVFPNFIKRYCQPCLHVLEYISCQVRKGEDIFWHIDDPAGLLTCEDRIVRVMRRLEEDCGRENFSALLNAKYTQVYNRPITVFSTHSTGARRFPLMDTLAATARQFFGKCAGVLALVNTLIKL